MEFKGKVVQTRGLFGFFEAISQYEALVVQVGNQDSQEILNIRYLKGMYEHLGLKLRLSHRKQKTGVFCIRLQIE